MSFNEISFKDNSLNYDFIGIENFKYANEDKFVDNENFKQGFIAGVKIMSSILLDI